MFDGIAKGNSSFWCLYTCNCNRASPQKGIFGSSRGNFEKLMSNALFELEIKPNRDILIGFPFNLGTYWHGVKIQVLSFLI